MKKIGIVGLGMLGNAVALHLLDSGFEVTVFNRNKDKTIQAKEKGAIVVDSPKEVAKKSDILIIVVKDADAVKQVSFGEDGIVNGENEKLIVADMSTIDPSESKNISEKFQEFNINKLDIPVMGGPNVAITGDLVMMVSGNKESFEECKNIFEKIANKVFFLGDKGVAHSVKLAMNLQITMLALALSEGITLVKKADVDPKIFLEILNSTYFKTGMSKNKAFKMIEGKYEPTFTLENLKKDITTMTHAAKSLGIKLPMIEKAEEVYENAVNEGLGGIDYTGIIEYIKRINKSK
ncbi:NAD(P)-dependent oxidoreductase [Nitrosopumilus sp.]|uniref:NAD(P)-dependent oxidoreductase n=1 Tax=Nitrosopumilus sp. TaxID=2024843 RepID=UPI003D125B4A